MIIVTGGAGFIGSCLISRLNAEGITDILVVDNIGVSGKWRNLRGKRFSQYLHKAEFLTSLESGKLTGKFSAIFHLGACSSTTEMDTDYLMTNNLHFTQKLAAAALKTGARFIYASSGATYGSGENGYDDDPSLLHKFLPLNPYGFSKHLFDLWAQQTGISDQIAGLKFFNVYGPNEYYKNDMSSIVWKSFNKITQTGGFSLFKSHRPDYRDGEQMRDFVYVKDCCSVMLWLFKNPSVNGVFNVGSGKARTWNDLVNSVFKAMNRPSKIEYIPMPEALINQYQYYTEAPISRLKNAGFNQPFSSIEEGVTDYISQHLLKVDQHL